MQLSLQLLKQRLDEPDVARRLHLRDDDDVQPRARARYDVDHVVMRPQRIDGVDAHRSQLAPPVEIDERRRDVLPRPLLVRRRDRIFQVEEHEVGVAVRRPHDHLFLRAGCRQLRSPQSRRHDAAFRAGSASSAMPASARISSRCSSSSGGRR